MESLLFVWNDLLELTQLNYCDHESLDFCRKYTMIRRANVNLLLN